MKQEEGATRRKVNHIFNLGLPTSDSWLPTLKKIPHQGKIKLMCIIDRKGK
jgi:hypothetical protein